MDVPELIEQLSRPAFYPDPTSRVEVVQTHISTVFLTDRYVYKVKKPVDFGFLDYTTLEKRRAMCDKEVALNARLCPDVYVGTVAITRSGDRLSLDGDGEVVEHAVKMVRLPEDRMLRQVLARGEAAPAIFVRIAGVLADFHARAETSPAIADMKRLDGVKFNCDENFQQTEPYVGRLLTRQRFDLIRTSTDLFFARHRALFERRADEGRVRDGHGDLHLDSICVTDPVSIFDCIEFNERFRYQDVAEEVAFLAMDLEFHGHPDLARVFVDAYVTSSGDRELLRLLDFYKAYRAYVRAKINSFQLDDPNVPAERREAIETTARRYYELAERYACAFNPRRLFVTCGLTGSGKSTLARKLAEMYGVEVLRSDRVRKELLGLQPEERRHVPYGVGEYAPSMTGQTYAAMAERAEALLAVGRSVVLDGCFIKRAQRAEALAVARRLAVPIVLLECRASEEVVRQRLERRVAKTGSVSDGRWEIYCTQLKEFEPPDEFPPADRVVLDRSRPIEELTGVLAGLGPPEWRGEPRD
jgi:aminoglycoside phosphotransferase family enzyme/predicted kinase